MVSDHAQHSQVSNVATMINGTDSHGAPQTTPPPPPPNGSEVSSSGDSDDDQLSVLGRTRPRVFPYTKHLPYQTEQRVQREQDVDEMIKHLYLAVAAGDFSPGAVHWTREIRGWMALKFDLTRQQRISLVKLYYELALAPGLEYAVAERFSSMFMVLTKRKHYLRPVKDLTLDWRPLYKEMKVFVLPTEFAAHNTFSSKRNVRTLTKMCTFAQLFFDPREIPAMLDEYLPYFSMSYPEHAFVVLALINLTLPTSPPPPDVPELQPAHYLPTLFHLWSVVARSVLIDQRFIDLFSRLSRDCLGAEHIPFTEHGIFTAEQSSLIFTSILRLLEIPVGQSSSPHSVHVDITAGLSVLVERDQRKHPTPHSIARWIVMSLSPACVEAKEKSILHHFEGLIQGIETFFHPSNSGVWTKTLSQLVYYLADFFVLRWNREQTGEYKVPPERRLNDEVKKRFVLCLRDVVFMGIYAKSATAVNFSLSTLQSLAFLEPNLILPGALQRIYPAMQGLVEVHRTISSIRALQMLSRIMARNKGYRCHLTTLLGLSLPGIDANDLDKTMNSLAFIQSVCYNIPLHDLTKSKSTDAMDLDGEEDALLSGGTAIAVEWVTQQVDRFEQEGALISVDYESELTDAEEEIILRSSTAGFAEFLHSFIGKVFTLLQNLPDASRLKSGSPEENVINTLPAAFTPLLAALSPELYDIALQQVAKFINNHVVHQARDAMAFIINAVVKVSPKKALARFLPDLISNIRTEIDENGAGSTRTSGSEILPRDRALVWHISLLSMCVVHVGSDILEFKDELLDIAGFMQEKCKGIPLVHVSNFLHHLLLNHTLTYTTDLSSYEKKDLDHGLGPADWGKYTDPQSLNIEWHVPNQAEVEFAIEIFKSQGGRSVDALKALTSDNSPVKRDGSGKEWSDEVSRHLVLLRLLVSGISCFFRSDDESVTPTTFRDTQPDRTSAEEDRQESAEELADPEDDKIRKTFQYPTGYSLDPSNPEYEAAHKLRHVIGETLHRVHGFLVRNQEDDVISFNALYMAYRSWFIDIGIERSAHVLDRLTRLLAADIHPFKFGGIRKAYPRPLLVKRANVYHFQRLRYNESPRAASDLDKTLLLDLAHSSVSVYTEIRRHAQTASEAAIKCIIGSKTLIIPPLLDALESAVSKNDFPRIKGAVFSLLFGSLVKPVGRNWKFTPRMIRLYIKATEADKPSIQKLVGNASFQIADMCKASDLMVILDEKTVANIWPENGSKVARTVATSLEDAKPLLQVKQERIKKRRAVIESKKAELANELVTMIKDSHWKRAARIAVLVVSLDYRFNTIASDGLLGLIVQGSIDPHPSLRTLYFGALLAIFNMVQTRALAEHKYENFLLDRQFPPDAATVPIDRDDPEWTKKHLEMFAKPEADYYVDTDYTGWLVWKDTMKVSKTGMAELSYDQVEKDIRAKIGKLLDRHWFSTIFSFSKQEPKDANWDRFRMTNATTIAFAFDLVFEGLTPATFEDIKDLTKATFGDGSDRHQHRATAEILGALISTAEDFRPSAREQVWEFAFPIVRRVFQEGLTPENRSYWSSFCSFVISGKDPRRIWPLLDWLAGFRLDMGTNAAFKESSKIHLLQNVIHNQGWHFQMEKPIVEDFLKHIDHPYKGVREQIGTTLSTIFVSRYHESYRDVKTLLEAQKEASSIGTRPYQPTEEFTAIITDVFERLEKWRIERPPGIQTSTSYTQASKTVLLWLESTLNSYECTVLVKFFPDMFMKQLLHMMDVKEDPELQSQAYTVFRQLPNIPHRSTEDKAFIDSLIEIGKTSTSWHQRLRVLINIQVIFFRHLFLMKQSQAQELLDCVIGMLHDVQIEVRAGAALTISGLIRCSPTAFRDRTVSKLKLYFTKLLIDNPLPKRSKLAGPPGTPTPEQGKLVLNRHAGALGLGALIQAFPYTSPPPDWLPEVLATLATRVANDPGMVGKSVKTVLSDFKKTRQDTWHVDVKAFSPEQLEDLEGVLWKSYFA